MSGSATRRADLAPGRRWTTSSSGGQISDDEHVHEPLDGAVQRCASTCRRCSGGPRVRTDLRRRHERRRQYSMPARNRNGFVEPVVLVQMKSTQSLRRSSGGVPRFDLDIRAYDLLRDPDRITPAVLIVVELPAEPGDWIEYTEQRICLSHRAHWTKMRSLAEVPTHPQSRSSLPEALDAERLWDLLDSVDRDGGFT